MNRRDYRKDLASLEEQRRLIKDRVRGVRDGAIPGLFLCGPPGNGKTYTVLEACKEFEHPPFTYYRGHITPIGLFELLADQSESTIVLDDVHAVLDDQKALQILLAAFGSRDESDGARLIKYRRNNCDYVVRFRGGIIAISNLDLRSGGERRRTLLDAVASRIHVLQFVPTSQQITALMYELARRGWRDHSGDRFLSSSVCVEVADFILAECQQLDRPLDLRFLVEKAFPDYWLWSTGETDNHWHQLVQTSLHERSIFPPKSSNSDVSEHRRIAIQIYNQFESKSDRMQAWREATATDQNPKGKSERAFYRRVDDVRKGLI